MSTKKKKKRHSFYEKRKPNRFMKTLKVLEEFFVEYDDYLVFTRGGIPYAVSMELGPFIYRISMKEGAFSLAEEMISETHYHDVIDALTTKRESRIMNGDGIRIEEMEEIEEIVAVGKEAFIDKVLEVGRLEEEDEEAFEEYLKDGFYPSAFQWEFIALPEKVQDVLLLLPALKEFDERYRAEYERTEEEKNELLDEKEEEILGLTADSISVRASDFKEKVKQSRETPSKKTAGKGNKPKHPADVFTELTNREKHLLHEEARAMYVDVRSLYPEAPTREFIDELAELLYDKATDADLEINIGQMKQYLHNNQKNLEKNYRKHTLDRQ